MVAENSTGYFGVYLSKHGLSKPYQAQVRRGGRKVYLGSFAIAEEAALCVARTPEGRAAAAERAAAAPPLQASSPPPAPPAIVRCTAPPPRGWRSGPGTPACHRASPAPGRACSCCLRWGTRRSSPPCCRPRAASAPPPAPVRSTSEIANAARQQNERQGTQVGSQVGPERGCQALRAPSVPGISSSGGRGGGAAAGLHLSRRGRLCCCCSLRGSTATPSILSLAHR